MQRNSIECFLVNIAKFLWKPTLLAFNTPTVSGVIFRNMALSVSLWEFECEHLKNNTNKDRP